jgi:hypothetical protein
MERFYHITCDLSPLLAFLPPVTADQAHVHVALAEAVGVAVAVAHRAVLVEPIAFNQRR